MNIKPASSSRTYSKPGVPASTSPVLPPSSSNARYRGRSTTAAVPRSTRSRSPVRNTHPRMRSRSPTYHASQNRPVQSRGPSVQSRETAADSSTHRNREPSSPRDRASQASSSARPRQDTAARRVDVPRGGTRAERAAYSSSEASTPRTVTHSPSPAPPEVAAPTEPDDILVGRVLGRDDYYDIRALNRDFVPQLVVGEVDLLLRDNGRFGREDHLQWPQYFCADMPHLALIPRQPRMEHLAATLWQVPRRAEFTRANHHLEGEAFGVLTRDTLDALDIAIDTLRPDLDSYRESIQSRLEGYRDMEQAAANEGDKRECKNQRLRLNDRLAELDNLQARLNLTRAAFAAPSTFAMCLLQWGHVHRCFAECWAWMEWQRIAFPRPEAATRRIHPGLDGRGVMGAVCDNAQDALLLHKIGIPVWLATPKKTASSRLPPKTADVLKPEDCRIVLTKHDIPMSIGRKVVVGSAHAKALQRISAQPFDFEKLSANRLLRPLSERRVMPSTRPNAQKKGQLLVATAVELFS